ncbi:MAG TPA: hypothetical protein VMY05_08885 [Acidobacteriota bacterium]|nr:hypothetical protein [Acidobacteriota bacterium]
MKSRIIVALALTLVSFGSAEAANVAVIASPPGLLSVVVLVFACACVVVGLQVRSIVRGGMLARSWQLLVTGFALLALVQLVRLLHDMEVLALPVWVVPGLLLLMTGVFFYGLFAARQTLG